MSIRVFSWSLTAAALCLTAAGAAQAQINVAMSVRDVSCYGGGNGAATATASGGAAPYTYYWPTIGVTGNSTGDQPAGSYDVKVTDSNQATVTKNVTIVQPNPLRIAGLTGSNPTGPGGYDGSATVSVAGGTGTYSYSWTPTGGTAATASALQAGTYTVIVTDANGCTTNQGITLVNTVPAAPAVISSVAVPANGTYTSGQTLSFTVNFDKAVSVDASGGTPSLTLTVGSTTRHATYMSGSGSQYLQFQYQVMTDDIDSDGIVVRYLSLNGGTIRNDSVDAALPLHNLADTSGVLVSAPPAPPAPPAPIPTMTEWAMMLLAGLLGLFGMSRLARRRGMA